MNRSFFLPLLLLLSFHPTISRAQPTATASAIQEAELKADLGRWVDAIEQYQRVLESAGDDLVPVEPPVKLLAQLIGGPGYSVPWIAPHSIPARWVCHAHLSRLPAPALKQYRDRVDAAAAKRLEDGRRRSDDRLLEKLLADWFCSRSGEEAILLLAQRAFDRADFDAAERYWRMLLPHGDNSSELRYPNPLVAPATVRARLILVELFRGKTERARSELKAFRMAYPDSSGLLAGRDGKYVETLEALLVDRVQVHLPAIGEEAKEWATFAGNRERNSDITGGLPRYWPGSPTWQSAIPGDAGVRLREDERPASPDHPRSLAFHPVIAHGRAFLCDALRVHSFDLLTGERSTLFDLRKSVPMSGVDLRLPVRSDVRYTSTYANGFLYARLGTQALRPPRIEQPAEADAVPESYSAILCLGPITDKREEAIRPFWTLRPPAGAKDSTAIFEGSPLIDGDRLYAVVWRQKGGEVVESITCYRGLGQKNPPELLWEREAGKPAFNLATSVQSRHDLLTRAGPNVVFCSHSGKILAVNSLSGLPAWEYRYPRNERRPPPVGRELCPCLFDGSRIFAAPNDSHRLLCLDGYSGRLLWDREGVDIVHLLGVARGRLIATFAGHVKGIRGINVANGAETLPDGWTQHDDGGVATFGRGFVSPDLIFWPTKHGLQFLNPEDGSPARQPVPGHFGNLAYADSTFIVATATEVWGFVSEGKRLEPRRKEVEKQPTNKLIIYRLGISEADVGNREEALKQFAKVEGGDDDLVQKAFERAAPLLWEKSGRPKKIEEIEQIEQAQTLSPGCPWKIPDQCRDLQLPLQRKEHRHTTDIDHANRVLLPVVRDRISELREPVSIPNDRLAAIHCREKRLYALYDSRALLAIDLPSGKIAWMHWAISPRALGGEGAVAIRPFFHAGLRFVVLQLSTGVIRIVSSRDGSTLHERKSFRQAWTADPVVIDEKTAAFPEGAEFVTCIDLETGRERWRQPIGRPSSLVGNQPQLRHYLDLLFIGVERNQGFEMDALDIETGKSMWSDPLFLGHEKVYLSSLGLNETAGYLPIARELLIFSTQTGRPIWKKPIAGLEDGDWRIVSGDGEQFLMFPRRPVAVHYEAWAKEWRRFTHRLPTVPGIGRLIAKSYDVLMKRTFPVLVFYQCEGVVVDRIDFPALGMAGDIRFEKNGVVVTTAAGCWILDYKARAKQ